MIPAPRLLRLTAPWNFEYLAAGAGDWSLWRAEHLNGAKPEATSESNRRKLAQRHDVALGFRSPSLKPRRSLT